MMMTLQYQKRHLDCRNKNTDLMAYLQFLRGIGTVPSVVGFSEESRLIKT